MQRAFAQGYVSKPRILQRASQAAKAGALNDLTVNRSLITLSIVPRADALLLTAYWCNASQWRFVHQMPDGICRNGLGARTRH